MMLHTIGLLRNQLALGALWVFCSVFASDLIANT